MDEFGRTRGGRVGRHGRIRTACIQCRSAKVRCEMEYLPCARCSRLSMDCSLGITASTALRRESDSVANETRVDPYPSLPAGEAAPVSVTDRSPAPTTFEVNGLSLSRERVYQLFHIFYEKYHTYVPFLEPARTFSECYNTSKFLFWTIVSVSARDQADGEFILSELSPFFSTTIGQLFVGCRHNNVQLSDVQALILLALWPWVNVYWWTDRSRILSHLAITLGMEIGLHLPHFWTEYGIRSAEQSHQARDERVRTWCASVAVAQNMESDFGLFSNLPFSNAAIRAVCRAGSTYDLPDALRHYLLIQESCHAAFSLLELPDSVESSERFSDNLIANLPECERLLCGFRAYDMSLYNRLNYLAAEMYVRCMYFQVSPVHQQRKPGILRAYGSASEIIELAVAESGRTTYTLYYAPRTVTRMLLCAALVVFKVLHSAYHIDVSYDMGKLLFNAATTCICQQAVRFRDSDTPIRFANFLRRLWEHGEARPECSSYPPSMPAVKTRGGACLIYDFLAMIRDAHRPSQNRGIDAAEGPSVDNDSSDYQHVQSDPNGPAGVLGSFSYDWVDAEFDASLFDIAGDFTGI